jgi:predicted transcriptional regulator
MSRTSDQKKYDHLIRYLQTFFAIHTCATTYDEMLIGAELSSKCLVGPYLKRLIADGMVQREPGKARTLRLTDKGRS